MPRSFKVNLSGAAALAAALALAGAPAAAGATCAWSVTPSANGATTQNRLDGISADSASDAWAVGFFLNSHNALSTLAERWNGSKWVLYGIKNGGAYDNVLSGVSAQSPTNAWAAGYYYNGQSNEPLIEHWNGTAWAITASPKVGGVYGGNLNAILALSPTNVWAAGAVNTGNTNPNTGVPPTVGLIEHWNGAAWSIVTSANEGSVEDTFTGLTAVNANDIWAGGVYSSTTPGFNRTLAEHWNGTAWKLFGTKDPSTSSSNINAIGAVSTSSVFATGDFYDSATGITTFRTLNQHWNGTAWAIEASENVAHDQTDLSGIAAVSNTEVISVGSYFNPTQQTFAMLWNGTVPSVTATLNPGPNGDYFDAASTIPGTVDAWAGGGTLNANGYVYQTLIERYHCT